MERPLAVKRCDVGLSGFSGWNADVNVCISAVQLHGVECEIGDSDGKSCEIAVSAVGDEE